MKQRMTAPLKGSASKNAHILGMPGIEAEAAEEGKEVDNWM